MRSLAWTGVVLFALPLIATASDGDKEYRHHTMEAIGGHMQAIVNIMKGEVPHTSHLPMHASAMAGLERRRTAALMTLPADIRRDFSSDNLAWRR